jgi:putative flippase GtrA|tara:strand:+ start:1394 stop:1777 length:384 start_codon:yes stop_codon:yes gene_type:complete
MPVIAQLLKYGSVGFITNVFGYTLYIFIANFLYLNPPIAAIVSGFLVTGMSYYLNKRFTFQNNEKKINLVFHYYALYLTAIFIHALIIFTFSNLMGFPHEVIAGISLIGISCMLFIIQKFFIFNSKK